MYHAYYDSEIKRKAGAFKSRNFWAETEALLLNSTLTDTHRVLLQNDKHLQKYVLEFCWNEND